MNESDSDSLNFAYQEIPSIPSSYTQSVLFTISIKKIDFTECSIRDFSELKKFQNLEVLILDKTELQSLTSFPVLPVLHTLSCNNNNITQLSSFLTDILEKYPKLQYLSLMRNPVHPLPLVTDLSCTPDVTAMQIYRLFIIYKLPGLTVLDAETVTEEERQLALHQGKQFEALNNPSSFFSFGSRLIPKSIFRFPIMSRTSNSSQISSNSDSTTKTAKIRKTTSAMKFESKHSEGNRFIRNTKL